MKKKECYCERLYGISSYYAVFYAVSAWFLERNLSFKKHSGVRNAFHRYIIGGGLLDPQWSKLYDRLF
ncbi:MAG TPA: HEPN domain-containing protein [Firmicutes bacterium]|nr:HEPN domain-containing protein [Bacillota bacterium]